MLNFFLFALEPADEGGEGDLGSVSSEMDEEENEEVIAAFRETQRQEVTKANHTTTQNKLWHRMLALRIKMQAQLAAANGLPLPEDAPGMALASQSQTTQMALKSQMQTLVNLRGKLLAGHLDFESVHVELTPEAKASSGEWWAHLERANAASRIAEESVTNQWSRQTTMQSGRALKALGRTVVDQVHTSMLQDREKLRRRTQLNRANKVPLGRTARREYEVDMFDDSEFYGHLLKTFLQATGAAAPGAASRGEREKKRTRSVAKSKLNLQIQEKLLNFMAPLESNVLPPMADALFSSLFQSQ